MESEAEKCIPDSSSVEDANGGSDIAAEVTHVGTQDDCSVTQTGSMENEVTNKGMQEADMEPEEAKENLEEGDNSIEGETEEQQQQQQEPFRENASENVEEQKDEESQVEEPEEKQSQEKSIGITQYAGTHSGFFGIIKQRYSDFLVNEVNSSGELVCITEQIIPHEPEEVTAQPLDSELPPELTPEIIKELNRLVGIKEPRRLPYPPKKPALDSSSDAPLDTEEEQQQQQKEEEDGSDRSQVGDEGKDTPAPPAGMQLGENGIHSSRQECADEEEDANKQNENEENTDIKRESGLSTDVQSGAGVKTNESWDDVEHRETQQDSQTNSPPNKSGKVKEVLINVENVNREGRTAIHKAIKGRWTAVDSIYNGGKYIIVTKMKAPGRGPRRGRSNWPKSQMYTTFVLYKENMDTMDAINQLAYMTRVRPNNFGFAGTKDKRAKTSQLVSVRRVAPHKLMHAVRYKKILHLGNFRFRPTPQKLGQLRGNHFKIVLRDVRATDEKIFSAIESLKTTGFINYFGGQRFGTTSIATHTIGRELLKSNWQEAINLILAPRETDFLELNRCRKIWKESGDARAALDALPCGWESSSEAQLLTGLAQLQRNDLVGALSRIPRNTRLLYLHAYQSYLWNLVASRRVEKYGLKVLPGDIVRKKTTLAVEDELPVITPLDEEGAYSEKVGTHWWTADVTKAVQEKREAYELMMDAQGLSATERKDLKHNYRMAKQKAKRVVKECKLKAEEEKLKMEEAAVVETEEPEPQISDDEDLDPEAKDSVEGVTSSLSQNFHFVTEKEVDTTDLCEVLMPLPGYNVDYPNNEIKEWYQELLEADGLSFAALKHKVKQYAVGGGYRRFIVKPSNISGTTCFYDDPNKPLVQSDMDKLQGIEVQDNRLEDGNYKAAIVEMTLPESCYATMALRELLKMDTSSQYQATLNAPIRSTSSSRMNGGRNFGSRRGFGHGRGGGPWRGRGEEQRGRGGNWRGFRGGWKGYGDRGGWRGRGGDLHIPRDGGGWRGGSGEHRGGSGGGNRAGCEETGTGFQGRGSRDRWRGDKRPMGGEDSNSRWPKRGKHY